MLSIDLTIIGLFVILTFIIGIYYGRGITTFQAYAVGDKKLSTAVITLSLVATLYGGRSLSGNINAFYHHGIQISLFLGYAIYFVYSRLLITRMKEFIGHLSIAESMGSLYGPTVRVITGLLGIIITTYALTYQINIGLRVITSLLPEITQWSTHLTILLGLLVISYATFGGARSVALTDVYQFLLFGLCIPTLTFILLYHTKDPYIGWQQSIKISIPTNVTNFLLVLTCYAATIFHEPAFIQRFYMTNTIPQAQKVFNRSAIIRNLLNIGPMSISIALYVGKHMIMPNQDILEYIIQLAYFPGIRGILVTTIFAVLMSSADSHIHAASILFTNDIWPILTQATRKTKDNKALLKVARIASVGIGALSLLVALRIPPYNYQIEIYENMYSGLVMIPFTMACFGFRPRAITVLCSMGLTAAITSYNFYYYSQIANGMYVFFFSLLSSICTLLLIHYLLPKRPDTGWVGIKDNSYWELQKQESKRWWKARWRQLQYPFTKQFLITTLPQRKSTFILLGCYSIFSTTLALFYIQDNYLYPYIYGYMAVMATGTILAIYPAFHTYEHIKKHYTLLQWLWTPLLFILLFIAPIQFVKLSQCNLMVTSLLICSLSIAIVLLSLEATLILLAIAWLIHSFIVPPHMLFKQVLWTNLQEATTIKAIFATMLTTAALVGYIVYTYIRNKTNAQLQVIALTRIYEHRMAIENIRNQVYWSKLDATYGNNLLQELSKMLKEPCRELYLQGQEKLGKSIYQFIKKIHQFGNLLPYRAKEEKSLKLNPKLIKMVPLKESIVNAYNIIHKACKPLRLLVRNQSTTTQILTDPELFTYLIMLNMQNVSQNIHAKDHMVTFSIGETTLHYNSTIVTLSGQPTFTLPALALCFSTDTAIQNSLPTYTIKSGVAPMELSTREDSLYQAESRQIVEAHGGYVAIRETQETLTCLYVLPINGNPVMRFKSYDTHHLDSNKPAETPESLAQEQRLTDLLTIFTSLNKKTVTKTIALIKHAHGFVSRKSGVPYYTHPMTVAEILLEVTKDPGTILAGLLHDIVEDTPITLTQIELMYGYEVAHMVDMVTIHNTSGYPWKVGKEENKRNLSQCNDIRVVQIKIADRLHNIRTIAAHKEKKQIRIAKETLDFYIEWGKKHHIPEKWIEEMEQICQKVLHTSGKLT